MRPWTGRGGFVVKGRGRGAERHAKKGGFAGVSKQRSRRGRVVRPAVQIGGGRELGGWEIVLQGQFAFWKMGGESWLVGWHKRSPCHKSVHFRG